MRILTKRRAGEPGPRGFIGGQANGKRGIRRLIKRDEADGLSMPEANSITETHTSVGPSSVGARIVRQSPLSPPSPGAGTKRIPKATTTAGFGRRIKRR